MIIIILLIIKLALFWVPYHFANLAYTDHMILKSYASDQSVLRYWLFTGANIKQVATVKMPEYLIAGETYPVNYSLIWGEIPDDGLVFQLTSSPTIEGLDTETLFDENNKDTEGSITISPSVQGDQPIKVVISGYFVSTEVNPVSISPMGGDIWVVPKDIINKLEKDRLKNGLIAIASLVIVVVIFIFIW